MCPTREKSYYLAANFNTSYIYTYIICKYEFKEITF